mgnify:CR=1 FL=1
MINQHFPSKTLEKDSQPGFLKNARLGVLGGSGLYSIESLENVKEVDIETPYGKPSDSLRIGNLGGNGGGFLSSTWKTSHFYPNRNSLQSKYMGLEITKRPMDSFSISSWFITRTSKAIRFSCSRSNLLTALTKGP